MNCIAVIEAFLQDRQRQCRPNTVRQYRTRLRPLREAFGERELQSITRGELLDWLHGLRCFPDGREKASDTLRADAIALQQLLRFAVDEEWLDASPLRPKDLRKPPSRRRERLPSEAEVLQLLDDADPHWARLYTALRLTGARPSELCDANIDQIESTPAGRLLVLTKHKTSGKSSTPRKIPISDAVAPLFDAAIGARRHGPIFKARDGKRWTVPRVSEYFRRQRAKAALDAELVLYSARHEFGSAVTRKLGINAARELLGHANITTTQRYAHTTDAELIAAQQQTHADTLHSAEKDSSGQNNA